MSEPLPPNAPQADPGYGRVRDFLLFGLSLPERALRSASGVMAGALRESASLLVPQAFQDSKTYNVMIRQTLDFLAEDVGQVRRREGQTAEPQVENFVARKAVGNFIDLAGLATFHLSPMLILAVVADVAYGSKAYLQELGGELKQQGVIDKESTIDQVDDLLKAVSATAQTAAGAFATPPLSLDGIRSTVAQTRQALASIDPTSVLPQAELQRLWSEIHAVAGKQAVSPLAVSSAMTLYSLDKIGQLGRGALSTVKAAGSLLDRHVMAHYQTALADIAKEGIYAALARTSKPYIDAVWLNFSPEKSTLTEGVLSGEVFQRAWNAMRGWLGRR